MIKIYPDLDFTVSSPYAKGKLFPLKIIWQGIHTCVETKCRKTKQKVIVTLPVGHSVINSYKVNTATGEIFCPNEFREWFGKPLMLSLQQPLQDDISLTIEKYRKTKKIIVLNCIDNLYGHALLKLFNAERHLLQNKKYGLVVIIQDFLRWLVPKGVAEIWTVKIPLRNAKKYYQKLDYKINNELKRFSEIYISKGYSHPSLTDISIFTKVQKYDDSLNDYRITYIWREDRPWTNSSYVVAAAKKLRMSSLLLELQNRKIVSLFTKIKEYLPKVQFTVSGIGMSTTFPSWIDDQRTSIFSDEIEHSMCKIYSESRLIIGVHGSNMLLPSAHAGMTVDLMPKERWGNFAQDIIFQERDSRISSFRYRFIPISTSVTILAHLIATQVREFEYFKQQMMH